MAKNKHHFVPRFYLAAFQSAQRRINVLGVDASHIIRDGSLRDQCYERKFYGKTDHVEDALAVIEGQAAQVLTTIRSTESLPRHGTHEHAVLLSFVAFQLLRTRAVGRGVNAFIDKTTKQAYSTDPRISREELESAEFGFDDPVLLALQNVGPMLLAIGDLHAHLAISSDERFITSDNPTFKYNQYCEGIDYQGTTGPLCRGFQIFLPLAPRLCLLLYDPVVYNVPRADRQTHRSIASSSDIASINAAQLVGADENVCFSRWERREEIQQLLDRVREHRIADRTVVQEYGQDTDPNRSLLHMFERTPNLRLSLSFLKVRWRARSVSLSDRAKGFRKLIPMPPVPQLPAEYRGSATFSRFIGRR